MQHNDIKYVKFMESKIDNVNYEEIYEEIKNNIDKTGYVCLTCMGCVISATRDKDFLEAINGSLLSIADGMPLAWYAKLSGSRKTERISGMELMRRLLEEENDFKHFLLGDTEQTINRVIYKARRVNNTIRISGYSPPFKHEFSKNDNTIMLDKINEESPDIIWVSFGGGKQDKWMRQNIHRLNRGVMIGVGAAFRFYIGEINPPPKIFQDIGLQWLFRLIDNPKRVGPVYMKTMPKFIVHFPFEVITARKEIKKERIAKAHPVSK